MLKIVLVIVGHVTPEMTPLVHRINLRVALGVILAVGGLVSLASPAVKAQGAGRYYPLDARVNLVARYGVDNTGTVDASAKINRAIKDYAGTLPGPDGASPCPGVILYLPPGIYRMIRPINYAEDGNARFVTLMGAGSGTNPAKATILKVPNGQNFDRYVIESNANTNMAFGVSISDLRISIGTGNPNASGIDFHASNQGTLANVTVSRSDGGGGTGISLATSENGPCLVKNVTVQGFQFGVDANADEYSFTLEHITVRDQRAGGAGVRGGGAVLAVRDLKSMQTIASVPGVRLISSFAHLALLDSKLIGRGGSAIVRQGGHFLLRGVVTSGYRDTYPSETVSDSVLTLQSSTATTLNLPINETPDEWDNNAGDWVAVTNSGGDDDTKNIQNALDYATSHHKPVVYFPRFDRSGKPLLKYNLSSGTTIHVPAGVKYILGMGNRIDRFGSPYAPLAPLFRFEGGSARTAVYFRDFHTLNYGGDPKQPVPVELWQDVTPRDLVLSHLLSLSSPAETEGGGAYITRLGTGRLYLEDVSVGGGWQISQGQKMWARQFNPEDYNSIGVRPLMKNDGATAWILGFKTEGAGPWIVTANGGQTEVFGAFQYINTGRPVFPGTIVPYQIRDADAALDFATFNFTGSDYARYIAVSRGGHTSFLDASGLFIRNTRDPKDASRDAPLLVSTGAAVESAKKNRRDGPADVRR